MKVSELSEPDVRALQAEVIQIPHRELVWLAAFFAAVDIQEFHEARDTYKRING